MREATYLGAGAMTEIKLGRNIGGVTTRVFIRQSLAGTDFMSEGTTTPAYRLCNLLNKSN